MAPAWDGARWWALSRSRGSTQGGGTGVNDDRRVPVAGGSIPSGSSAMQKLVAVACHSLTFSLSFKKIKCFVVDSPTTKRKVSSAQSDARPLSKVWTLPITAQGLASIFPVGRRSTLGEISIRCVISRTVGRVNSVLRPEGRPKFPPRFFFLLRWLPTLDRR